MKRFLLFISVVCAWVLQAQVTTVNLSFRDETQLAAYPVTAYQTNLTATVGGSAAMGDIYAGYWYFAPGDVTAPSSTCIVNAGAPAGRWRKNVADLVLEGTITAASYVGDGSALTGVEPDTTVVDITALRAYPAAVSGVWVTDTNRGGLFTYTTTAHATNAGTVYEAVGLGAGRWVRQYQGPVNFRWWVNTTDTATATAAAFGEVVNNFDNIYIPAGTWNMDFSADVVNVTANRKITITGDGKDKTILKYTGTATGEALIYINDPAIDELSLTMTDLRLEYFPYVVMLGKFDDITELHFERIVLHEGGLGGLLRNDANVPWTNVTSGTIVSNTWYAISTAGVGANFVLFGAPDAVQHTMFLCNSNGTPTWGGATLRDLGYLNDPPMIKTLTLRDSDLTSDPLNSYGGTRQRTVTGWWTIYYMFAGKITVDNCTQDGGAYGFRGPICPSYLYDSVTGTSLTTGIAESLAILNTKVSHFDEYHIDSANLVNIPVGPFTNGAVYKVITFAAGDDFSNIGGGNQDNYTFTATGTTATDWTHGSTVSALKEGGASYAYWTYFDGREFLCDGCTFADSVSYNIGTRDGDEYAMMYLHGEHATIRNNLFRDMLRSAVTAKAGGSTTYGESEWQGGSFVFENNTIDNCSAYNVAHWNNIDIIGNYWRNLDADCLFSTFFGLRSNAVMRIERNTMENCDGTGHFFLALPMAAHTGQRISFVGNYSSDPAPSSAVAARGMLSYNMVSPATPIMDIVMRDNGITYKAIGSEVGRVLYGYGGESVRSLLIEGNTIDTSGTLGIGYFDGNLPPATNVVVRENIFDVRGSPYQAVRIENLDSADSTTIRIEDNVLLGNTIIGDHSSGGLGKRPNLVIRNNERSVAAASATVPPDPKEYATYGTPNIRAQRGSTWLDTASGRMFVSTNTSTDNWRLMSDEHFMSVSAMTNTDFVTGEAVAYDDGTNLLAGVYRGDRHNLFPTNQWIASGAGLTLTSTNNVVSVENTGAGLYSTGPKVLGSTVVGKQYLVSLWATANENTTFYNLSEQSGETWTPDNTITNGGWKHFRLAFTAGTVDALRFARNYPDDVGDWLAISNVVMIDAAHLADGERVLANAQGGTFYYDATTTIPYYTHRQVQLKPVKVTQAVTAVGNTITSAADVVVLNPDGDYTLTSTPNITAGTLAGQKLTLITGNTEANTVTLTDNDTLAGSLLQLNCATRLLGAQKTLVLTWDGTHWLEESYGAVGPLTVADTLTIDVTGVSITGNDDGALTFLGLGNGNDENLTMDLDTTSNVAEFSSSTGVTQARFTGIGAAFGGNVGVGTNTPLAQLTIVAANTESPLYIENDNSGNTVGGTRGVGAIDLQYGRNTITMVASGVNSVIGGGTNNTASSGYSTVAGGNNNTASLNNCTTVGGGTYNAASGYVGTIAGGSAGTASGPYSSLGGGYWNTASGQGASVGGGHTNQATGVSSRVSGGTNNIASTYGATVSGGGDNTAGTGTYATVGGGWTNTATGQYSTISGGINNRVTQASGVAIGGSGNLSSGTYAIVGGLNSTASGSGSMALGYGCTALGSYSTALGYSAASPLYGQVSFAPGGGISQYSIVSAWVVATNSVISTNLWLDGVDDRIALPVSTTWVFDGMVVAHSKTNATAEVGGWLISGIIARDAASAVTLTAPAPTLIARTDAVWDIALAEDDANGALQINCTNNGEGAIYWGVTLRVMQMKGALVVP